MTVTIPETDTLVQFTSGGAGHLVPEGRGLVTRCGRGTYGAEEAPSGTKRCADCRRTLRPGASFIRPRKKGRSWPLANRVLEHKLAQHGVSLRAHRRRQNKGRGLHYHNYGKRPLERHQPPKTGSRQGPCKRQRSKF